MGLNINVDGNKAMKHKHSRVWIYLVTIIFLCVFIYLGFNGKHNKMPGFETNIDDKKNRDSSKNIFPSDTERHKVILYDTIRKSQPIKTEQQTSKKHTGKEIDTSKKSKYLISGGTFNAPTQIGDNNTQNNNYNTLPSRIATVESLKQFFIDYPDKNIRILFASLGSPTNEMNDFKNQIVSILKNKNYKNIDNDWFILYGSGKFTLEYIKVNDKIEFNIPKNE